MVREYLYVDSQLLKRMIWRMVGHLCLNNTISSACSLNNLGKCQARQSVLISPADLTHHKHWSKSSYLEFVLNNWTALFYKRLPGISSVRNKITPKISSKARDPVDIIADLFVLPERVILDKPIIEGEFSVFGIFSVVDKMGWTKILSSKNDPVLWIHSTSLHLMLWYILYE